MKRKSVLVACGCIAFMALVACSLYVSLAAGRQQSPPVQTVTTPETTTGLLNALTNGITHKYPYITLSKTPDQLTTIGYQLPSYTFKVLLPNTTDTALSFTDTRTTDETSIFSDLSAVFGTWQATFAQAGLKEIVSASTTSLLNASYFYQSPTEICNVTVYTLLDVTCASRSTLTSTAKQAAPLDALYDSAVSGLGQDTVVAPAIRSSQTPGYTIATMTIYNGGGATAANFYQKNGGTWNLVNLKWYNDPHEDADIIPNCGYFDSNSDVRSAFSGVACYDSATGRMSTIN